MIIPKIILISLSFLIINKKIPEKLDIVFLIISKSIDEIVSNDKNNINKINGVVYGIQWNMFMW